MTHTVTGWQLARANVVEGACLLIQLLCRLAGLFLSGLSLAGRLPGESGLWLLAAAVLQGVLLSPLRLGRIAYYRGMGLTSGWRRWLQAVGWRWQLWWRRTGMLILLWLPTALLWGWGEFRRPAGHPLLWLLAGAGLALLAVGVTLLWQCRYAPAPLLLLRGYPAGAAMQLAALAMRHHVGDYVNFLGSWALPLASCLLVVPAIQVLPRFHEARTAWLAARLSNELIGGA